MRILIVSADRTDQHGGACNLGDALLTDALADAIQSLGHTVQVYDFGHRRVTSDRQRLAEGRLAGLVRAIRWSDAVILGGGTLFQDDQPYRAVSGLPRMCAVVANMARTLRRPVAYFGIGCDPIERHVPRQVLKLAIAKSNVWVRDIASRQRFSNYFGRSAALGADTALLAMRHIDCGTTAQSKGIVLALARHEASSLSVELIDLWEEQTNEPVRFLSMEQQLHGSDAASLSRAVRARLNYRDHVLGWREAAEIVAESRAVVASRMHALYLAALHSVPAVGVGDYAKIASFCNEFQVPRVKNIAGYRPGLETKIDETARELGAARVESSLRSLLEKLGC